MCSISSSSWPPATSRRTNKKSDACEPSFDGSKVTVIGEVKEALDAAARADLLGMGMDYALGGAQLPVTIGQAGSAWLSAANISTAGYLMLTGANANLLAKFATPEQVEAFVRPMLAGRSATRPAGKSGPDHVGDAAQLVLTWEDRSRPGWHGAGGCSILERMYESALGSVSPPEVIARFDEMFERRHPSRTPESSALVDRICSMSRAENRAAAAQLAAIGELFAYRLSRCSDTEEWAVDTEAAVGAEVAAALRISQGLAGSRLRYARAMREQLPQVSDVFKAGEIDFRMFATIVYRTDLITDREVLAAVDAQLAVNVARWPSMTRGRLAAKVDKIVGKADADAVRRRKERQAGREIWIGDLVEGGISEIHGSLFTVDAHALEKRLQALAATVCEHDPRSHPERRADAMGALAAGADRLGCRCGRPDCAAGNRPAASPVVIHVIAEHASIDGSGLAPGSEVGADGLIPPELVAELAKSAKLVPLAHPGDAPPEPGYVPSKALADFVRCRDLTCRWPGCDQPATDCDLDHTIPHAEGGKTHASNLKCYCRTHHLVKTFWGWRDQQLPDGTLILTSPWGQTHVSTPGSALLFPSLCLSTGGAPALEVDLPADYCGDRTAMMPRRRRTRAQDRAHRIATERRQNHDERQVRRAERMSYFGPAPPDTDDDPPPF